MIILTTRENIVRRLKLEEQEQFNTDCAKFFGIFCIILVMAGIVLPVRDDFLNFAIRATFFALAVSCLPAFYLSIKLAFFYKRILAEYDAIEGLRFRLMSE